MKTLQCGQFLALLCLWPGAAALAAESPAPPHRPTLFLIGDSTVRNGQGKGTSGQWGWGEPLVAYFDATQMRVLNRALGGRSSRTFLTEGRWDAVVKELQPGDFVLMQFGHNDTSPLNDNARARGTIRGVGDETEEIDNQLTHQHEVVHTYGWYLRKFITATQATGATPIVLSPIPHNAWSADGKVRRNAGDYGKWAKDVAAAQKVSFIDLNAIIADQYDKLGREKVQPLFQGDSTHTSAEGAEINAAAVVAGLKALKDSPVTQYLSPKGTAVVAYASGATTKTP